VDDFAAYASVQAWLADYVRHWGPADAGVPKKLETLREFCQLVGRDPDAIVGECLRQVEEGKRIRLKARRRYIEAIREFEAGHEGARAAGNIVRSFFIHNGIAMSADVPGL
jgi:hypothetical protein